MVTVAALVRNLHYCRVDLVETRAEEPREYLSLQLVPDASVVNTGER